MKEDQLCTVLLTVVERSTTTTVIESNAVVHCRMIPRSPRAQRSSTFRSQELYYRYSIHFLDAKSARKALLFVFQVFSISSVCSDAEPVATRSTFVSNHQSIPGISLVVLEQPNTSNLAHDTGYYSTYVLRDVCMCSATSVHINGHRTRS